MKRGLSITRDRDLYGLLGVRITKARGKLSLDEVYETLKYGEGGKFNGHYALIINASESTCGGNDLWMEEETKGDEVFLNEIHDNEDCPVCGALLPNFEHCPRCGCALNTQDGGE